jgi:hypothetical protein
MLIELNPTEARVVELVSAERIKHCREIYATSTIYHKAGALENEIKSYGAEVAYCKMFNCYPTFDPKRFSFFDAVRHDGLLVDVKETERVGGRVLVKHKERKGDPDLYALFISEYPNYRYAGEISAKEVLQNGNIDWSLHHPAYALSQSRLSLVKGGR